MTAAINQGGVSSSANPATIPLDVWRAWLEQLSPAQLRAVLAQLVIRGPSWTIPADLQDEALELGPSVASLVAGQDVAVRSRAPAPPLVQAPTGELFYSAGGMSYRRVPPGGVAETLALDPAAVVPVAKPELPIGNGWNAGATPAVAFAEQGKLVAASGDVTAAYYFAAVWRLRVERPT